MDLSQIEYPCWIRDGCGEWLEQTILVLQLRMGNETTKMRLKYFRWLEMYMRNALLFEHQLADTWPVHLRTEQCAAFTRPPASCGDGQKYCLNSIRVQSPIKCCQTIFKYFHSNVSGRIVFVQPILRMSLSRARNFRKAFITGVKACVYGRTTPTI